MAGKARLSERLDKGKWMPANEGTGENCWEYYSQMVGPPGWTTGRAGNSMLVDRKPDCLLEMLLIRLKLKFVKATVLGEDTFLKLNQRHSKKRLTENWLVRSYYWWHKYELSKNQISYWQVISFWS